MTHPSSIKNHGGGRFLAKGLCAGQGLLCGDWSGVLPAQKLQGPNLATPESFIPIDPTVEKLINNLIIKESHYQPNPLGTPRGGLKSKNKKYTS